jgi:hypothetical protein
MDPITLILTSCYSTRPWDEFPSKSYSVPSLRESEYPAVRFHSSVALECPSIVRSDCIYYDKADNIGAEWASQFRPKSLQFVLGIGSEYRYFLDHY